MNGMWKKRCQATVSNMKKRMLHIRHEGPLLYRVYVPRRFFWNKLIAEIGGPHENYEWHGTLCLEGYPYFGLGWAAPESNKNKETIHIGPAREMNQIFRIIEDHYYEEV